MTKNAELEITEVEQNQLWVDRWQPERIIVVVHTDGVWVYTQTLRIRRSVPIRTPAYSRISITEFVGAYARYKFFRMAQPRDWDDDTYPDYPDR